MVSSLIALCCGFLLNRDFIDTIDSSFLLLSHYQLQLVDFPPQGLQLILMSSIREDIVSAYLRIEVVHDEILVEWRLILHCLNLEFYIVI